MASPFQQQARQRKVVYLGLIVVLFTLSWAWRRYAVEARANELYLHEQSRGEADLSGSVVRLTLTGSRGLATCVLWNNALERQKKNQWNELELVVRSLTKLQPHFITPWLFQSWNLAYNVSVESDRVADKYFYITRGIQLLGEGERQNRYHPDLRFHMGFYTANKIHIADETNVFRSLLQLSVIPPGERDPARFRTFTKDGRQVINWGELEQFCKDHPQLARRLSEGMRRDSKREMRRQFTCERPEDVVQFLADNFLVPSLYVEAQPADPHAAPGEPGAWERDRSPRKREVEDRFPCLPPPHVPPAPQHALDANELTDETPLDDGIDCHHVARAWYNYAQEPIPDPGELPGSTSDITVPALQRRPKNMTTLLFRNYPARAQSYVGERLQQEGWFDDEGWEPARWFKDRKDQDGAGRALVVGNTEKWSQRAWEDAARLWERVGKANKLLLSPTEERNYNDQAAVFLRKYQLKPGDRVPDNLRTEEMGKEEKDQYFAARFLWEYDFYRRMSNFPHHYSRANIEKDEATIQARKLFYLADRLYYAGEPEQALQLYERPDAMRAWRDKVLLPNKEFRRERLTQEDSYEIEAAYLDLYNSQHGKQLRQFVGQRLSLLALAGAVGQASVRGGVVPDWYPLVALRREKLLPENLDLVAGPFDIKDSEGVPLIADEVVQLIEDRRSDRGIGRVRRRMSRQAPARAAPGAAPGAEPAAPQGGGLRRRMPGGNQPR